MLRRGFTLVEILIVVLILGILAAIALPKFSNASAIARASMLADDLRIMRAQIQVYKSLHREVPPGHPDGKTSTPTEADFVSQMTLTTNAAGQTAPIGTAGYEYGPYLREMPVNPVNGKRTIEIIANGAALPTSADDSHGWIYQPQTLTFLADSVGQDDQARSYFGY